MLLPTRLDPSPSFRPRAEITRVRPGTRLSASSAASASSTHPSFLLLLFFPGFSSSQRTMAREEGHRVSRKKGSVMWKEIGGRGRRGGEGKGPRRDTRSAEPGRRPGARRDAADEGPRPTARPTPGNGENSPGLGEGRKEEETLRCSP